MEEEPTLPDLTKNESVVYPCLMTQWHWGVQAYWSDVDGVFWIQKDLSSDFQINNSEGPLVAINVTGIKPFLNRKELGWGWFWAKSAGNDRTKMHRQLIHDQPAEDMDFWLSDIALPEMKAAGRAYQVTNTPEQPHLKIARSAQVLDMPGYNKQFDEWKVAGFVGAICQQYEELWDDPHLLSDLVMGRKGSP